MFVWTAIVHASSATVLPGTVRASPLIVTVYLICAFLLSPVDVLMRQSTFQCSALTLRVYMHDVDTSMKRQKTCSPQETFFFVLYFMIIKYLFLSPFRKCLRCAARVGGRYFETTYCALGSLGNKQSVEKRGRGGYIVIRSLMAT